MGLAFHPNLRKVVARSSKVKKMSNSWQLASLFAPNFGVLKIKPDENGGTPNNSSVFKNVNDVWNHIAGHTDAVRSVPSGRFKGL